MKRQRHLIDDSAYPVFITTTIIRWLPVFSEVQIAKESLCLLESIRSEMDISVIAYVLMPSHLHAIIKSLKKGDISVFMKKWKSQSARIILEYCRTDQAGWLSQFEENARQYIRLENQKYQVWMPRFDDYAIRNTRQLLIKLNYIHGNPLRDNLVRECVDYPYSSMRDYMGGTNGFIKIECGQGKP
jgi:REP element-mobilizing transposase RayT